MLQGCMVRFSGGYVGLLDFLEVHMLLGAKPKEAGMSDSLLSVLDHEIALLQPGPVKTRLRDLRDRVTFLRMNLLTSVGQQVDLLERWLQEVLQELKEEFQRDNRPRTGDSGA